MMILRLGNKLSQWAECVSYAISGNLSDKSFESCSVIKFTLVTPQQMRCFVTNILQFDSEYSLSIECWMKYSVGSNHAA